MNDVVSCPECGVQVPVRPSGWLSDHGSVDGPCEGSWTGRCQHCGDVTYAEDDPAADLCAMCRIAGRMSRLL